MMPATRCGACRPRVNGPVPLAGGLVSMVASMLELSLLPRFHAGQPRPLGRAIARQLIRDDDPRDVAQPREPRAEAGLCGVLMASTVHEQIAHRAVLNHRPLQILALATDRQKEVVQMPCVARSRPQTPELVGRALAERVAPLTDGFGGHEHPMGEQPRFDIAGAAAEAEGAPDPVSDPPRCAPTRIGAAGQKPRS
jgi:hypothetical protein